MSPGHLKAKHRPHIPLCENLIMSSSVSPYHHHVTSSPSSSAGGKTTGSPAAASCSLRSKTRGEFSPSLVVLDYGGGMSRLDEKADATTQNFHRIKPSE